MKNKFTAVILFLVVFMFSCSNKENYPTLGYIYKEHNFKYGKCDSAYNDCVKINIKTIEITNSTFPSVKDSIQRKVKEFALSAAVNEIEYNSFEELQDSIVENYKSIRKAIPDMNIGYELNRNVTVTTDTLGVLALKFYQFSFFGGAHPNYFTEFSNIDLSTGKEIKLNTLLTPGYQDKLNEIGEKKFRELRKLKPDEDLQQAGYWFENSKFKLNENFLITKEGIIFFYNPYEIAPYSYGTCEILIEFTAIKDLIKSGSILTRFAEGHEQILKYENKN